AELYPDDEPALHGRRRRGNEFPVRGMAQDVGRPVHGRRLTRVTARPPRRRRFHRPPRERRAPAKADGPEASAGKTRQVAASPTGAGAFFARAPASTSET